MTFAELQYHLKIMKFSEEQQDCQQCGKPVVRTCHKSLKEFCDPDFLTILFEQTTNFDAPPKKGTRFGSSRYFPKTVVHWVQGKESASVSREKKDGWWWHGVDKSQGPDFHYNAEQITSGAHLRDVTVMMMVRMGDMNDGQESGQQHANLNCETEEREGGIILLSYLFSSYLFFFISLDGQKDSADDEIINEEGNVEKVDMAKSDGGDTGRNGKAHNMRTSQEVILEGLQQNVVGQQEGGNLHLSVKSIFIDVSTV